MIGKGQTVGGVTKSIGYGYANGRLASLLTPSGQTIGYTYDANDQVSAITLNGATLLSAVQHDPFGPISGWMWANGTLTVRSYDSDGRLALIDSAGLATYAFHDDGSIASRTPPPWSLGGFQWDIPVRWRVAGTIDSFALPNMLQVFSLNGTNGSTTVSKAGASVTRVP